MTHVRLIFVAVIVAITSGCTLISSNSSDASQTQQVKQEISPTELIKKYMDEMNREDYHAAAALFGVKTNQELDKMAYDLYFYKHHTHEIKEFHKILHETIDGDFAIYVVGIKKQFPNTTGYVHNIDSYNLYKDNGNWVLDNYTKDQARLKQYDNMYASKSAEIKPATREYLDEFAKSINDKFFKENPNYKDELFRNQEEKSQILKEIRKQNEEKEARNYNS